VSELVNNDACPRPTTKEWQPTLSGGNNLRSGTEAAAGLLAHAAAGGPGPLSAEAAAALGEVCRYISKYHMSVNCSECQVSKLVNSDTHVPTPHDRRRESSARSGMSWRACCRRCGTASGRRSWTSGARRARSHCRSVLLLDQIH
jgi:hypothetical protein